MKQKQIRSQKTRRAYPKLGEGATTKTRKCLDGCGKDVTGRAAFASDACRKRYQRSLQDNAKGATTRAKVNAILEKKPKTETAPEPATPTEATPEEKTK